MNKKLKDRLFLLFSGIIAFIVLYFVAQAFVTSLSNVIEQVLREVK